MILTHCKAQSVTHESPLSSGCDYPLSFGYDYPKALLKKQTRSPRLKAMFLNALLNKLHTISLTCKHLFCTVATLFKDKITKAKSMSFNKDLFLNTADIKSKQKQNDKQTIEKRIKNSMQILPLFCAS